MVVDLHFGHTLESSFGFNDRAWWRRRRRRKWSKMDWKTCKKKKKIRPSTLKGKLVLGNSVSNLEFLCSYNLEERKLWKFPTRKSRILREEKFQKFFFSFFEENRSSFWPKFFCFSRVFSMFFGQNLPQVWETLACSYFKIQVCRLKKMKKNRQNWILLSSPLFSVHCVHLFFVKRKANSTFFSFCAISATFLDSNLCPQTRSSSLKNHFSPSFLFFQKNLFELFSLFWACFSFFVGRRMNQICFFWKLFDRLRLWLPD